VAHLLPGFFRTEFPAAHSTSVPTNIRFGQPVTAAGTRRLRRFLFFFGRPQATTRMEERLDDAINVLRNHAEPLIGPASGAPSVPSAAAAAAASHSNGLMAAYTPVLEPHMVCHVRLG